MDIQELIEEAKKFENNTKAKRIVEKAWQQHKKFLRLYPFCLLYTSPSPRD